MVKRLLFVLLLALAGAANAGYYVTVVSHTGSMKVGNFNVDGKTGLCYLTPSMALAGFAGTANYYIVTAMSAAGTWEVSGNGGTSAGTFSTCTAVPQVFTIPAFVGGVSDPAIEDGSILSASGGGSSGGCMEFITNAADAELIAGAFLLLLAIAFGVRQIRAAIESQHVSDEKH